MSRFIRIEAPLAATGTLTSSTGMVIQSTTQKIAIKFYSANTNAITHVDMRVTRTGTVTGTNFRLEIQTDSSDAPSGTVLGAATAEFAGPSGAGWLGGGTAIALGSNTGALTLNTPYWLVLYYSSGTAPDASNFVQSQHINVAIDGRSKIRHHNGTNWTTTAAVAFDGSHVRLHSDSAYTGYPFSASTSNFASATDIFGTNRQGSRFRFGSRVTLRGVEVQVSKVGSPNNLEVMIYEGATQVGGPFTLAAADVTTNANRIINFDPGVTINQGQDCYIILRQNGDGGTDANDYDLRGTSVETNYTGAIWEATRCFCYGTGNNPTTYTATNTFLPIVTPLIGSSADDLSVPASSGGGSFTFVG